MLDEEFSQVLIYSKRTPLHAFGWLCGLLKDINLETKLEDRG
jgi:hypothetical protein